MSLFRGSEYNRFAIETKKEPLTYYDMNLSAQDHQTFFTCEGDASRPDMEIMQTAWRERDPQSRINAAKAALVKNPDCATALILLAEEEATQIQEVERLLKQALRAAEGSCRKSLQIDLTTAVKELQHRRDTNVIVYIKRRLAMCARKLGKFKEAVKMMKDLIHQNPMMNVFNIHENLIECLLEMQAFGDLTAVLAKYDDINLPKSATICYTAALLKCRGVSDKFSPDFASKKVSLHRHVLTIIIVLYFGKIGSFDFRDECGRSHSSSSGIQSSCSKISLGNEVSDSSSRTHTQER